ncbi:MAG: hypothetical protein NC489_08115 [Ruminococcus flavefaciens]|nr:hypothetical protein [Ruminococcus flavefaciens]
MGKRQYLKIFVNGNYMCDCGGKTCKRMLELFKDESFDPVRMPMGLIPRVFNPHYDVELADEMMGRTWYYPVDPKMRYKYTYNHYTEVKQTDLESIAFMHILRYPNGKRRVLHIWAWFYATGGPAAALYQRQLIIPIMYEIIHSRKIRAYEQILQNFGIEKIDMTSNDPANII